MTRISLDKKKFGTAIPLSSIWTQESCGTGEFADLVPLAEWSKKAGLEIIQLLPLNDSGDLSAPYSALSAFALSPVYLRLSEIKGFDKLTEKPVCPKGNQVKFSEVYREKMIYLRTIYEMRTDEILKDKSVTQYFDEHSWLVDYALFKVLKEKHNLSHWHDWGNDAQLSDDDRRKLFEEKKQEAFFYIWVQYECDVQFRQAKEKLGKLGVFLKGDIPILMSGDSADVWAHSQLFDMKYSAGAPPDMFSQTGQNWGFPVYDWEEHERTGMAWWKERMRYMARYYDAIRIDHVLGFFRIWRISHKNHTGTLGFFHPFSYISKQDLQENGFDLGRILWLSEPHIAGYDMERGGITSSKEVVEQYLSRIDHQDLFRISADIHGEEDIEKLKLPAKEKEFLRYWYNQRSLIEVEEDQFFPAWYAGDADSFRILSGEERERFHKLVEKHYIESQEVWEKQGRYLLGELKSATDMLMCAEDLGAVPEIVPRVLQDMEILGLRVERWTRDYSDEPAYFIDPKDYPEFTVATSSVHDSSTLRGWWEEEPDRAMYAVNRGCETQEEKMTPEIAGKILKKLFKAKSKLVIIPLQDLFATNAGLIRGPAHDERVNIPGTVSDDNWSYRVPFSLEEMGNMAEMSELQKSILSWIAEA